MRWIWLLAIGCSAPARVDTPHKRCVALPPAGAHEIAGRVTDRAGKPLASVHVDEAVWSQSDGQWKRYASARTTTAADGTYRLTVPRHDSMVVFEHDHRRVVWGHVSTPGRIDVELDRNAAPGVIAMFDARVDDGDPCAAWQCPIDREPAAAWWTRPRPCPDGATLHFELAPDVAVRAGAGVRCELAGQPHGATTSWIMVEQQWTEESGWFEHGKRCGRWREASEPPHQP